MSLIIVLVTIAGLGLFEVISSIDNAIINAEVLSTMKPKPRQWFLSYGLFFSVFCVRGLLPWVIVWATIPQIGPIGALTATFSSDAGVQNAISSSAPILLVGGGLFLVFLFFHWLFLEPKNYGLYGEQYIQSKGVWFYAIVSVILTVVVWLALKVEPSMALGAVIGSMAFFITHGFKQSAQVEEMRLTKKGLSDISKIFYLEIIDATFSIDGVLGAFAFTFSIPLILIGNGLGAFIVRKLTMDNIHNIKRYRYLKNGAMYSILALGLIMVGDSFGFDFPAWISPLCTVTIVGYFFYKSNLEITKKPAVVTP